MSNHYHDAAIADKLLKNESSRCFQNAYLAAMCRYSRIMRLGGMDYSDSVMATIKLGKAAPVKSCYQGYHAINNECERLVG